MLSVYITIKAVIKTNSTTAIEKSKRHVQRGRERWGSPLDLPLALYDSFLVILENQDISKNDENMLHPTLTSSNV